jgi:hypothetical protein
MWTRLSLQSFVVNLKFKANKMCDSSKKYQNEEPATDRLVKLTDW